MKFILLHLVVLLLSTNTIMSQVQPDLWSSTKVTAIRLTPHQDLKKALTDFAVKSKIKAGFVVTCVGSLEQVNLRFANQDTGNLMRGYFEILSLVGTFSDSSAHLHLSVADSTGQTWGGHLLDESLIYTTAELVIGELTEVEFERIVDSTYGYKELSIKQKKKN
ncbi:MAG: PPC domain-containing DNA-binding protein [Cyclobacteriaceae bacterium]